MILILFICLIGGLSGFEGSIGVNSDEKSSAFMFIISLILFLSFLGTVKYASSKGRLDLLIMMIDSLFES